MIKVYNYMGDIVTVVITPKFKEVTVTSPTTGSNCYRATRDETKYGSMGSYVNNWLKALNGLKPVVVMD